VLGQRFDQSATHFQGNAEAGGVAVISIASIHQATTSLPPRLVVHGLPGAGKTTLAARFPRPVFLQTEDGTPAGLKLATFGLLQSYADVHGALIALGSEPHDFHTLVLDSLDKLEGLVWIDVCNSNKWASIEAPGYGRGYVIADKWWRDFLAALDWLRRERGMDCAARTLCHRDRQRPARPRLCVLSTPSAQAGPRTRARRGGRDLLPRH
jgi:hypothetical protein